MLAAAAGRGARVDWGGGGAFQRGSALMTPKNARAEARGFLVKFAGGSAEFQWEIVLIHDGQISPVSTRDRLKLGRGGVRCRIFCSNQPDERPAAENNRVPEG